MHRRADAYFSPPLTEPHCLILSAERVRIFLEANAEVVDELPLRIALEEPRPDVQHGEAQLKRLVWNSQFALLVEVDDSIRFFNDACDPVNDAVFRA